MGTNLVEVDICSNYISQRGGDGCQDVRMYHASVYSELLTDTIHNPYITPQQLGEQAIKMKLETAFLRCVDFNVVRSVNPVFGSIESTRKEFPKLVYCCLLFPLG